MNSAQLFDRVLLGPTRTFLVAPVSRNAHDGFTDDGRALKGQTECFAVFRLLLVCAVMVRVRAVLPPMIGHPIHHARLVPPHLVELLDWVVLESFHNVVREFVLLPERDQRCTISQAAGLVGLAAQCAKERQVADVQVGRLCRLRDDANLRGELRARLVQKGGDSLKPSFLLAGVRFGSILLNGDVRDTGALVRLHSRSEDPVARPRHDVEVPVSCHRDILPELGAPRSVPRLALGYRLFRDTDAANFAIHQVALRVETGATEAGEHHDLRQVILVRADEIRWRLARGDLEVLRRLDAKEPFLIEIKPRAHLPVPLVAQVRFAKRHAIFHVLRGKRRLVPLLREDPRVTNVSPDRHPRNNDVLLGEMLCHLLVRPIVADALCVRRGLLFGSRGDDRVAASWVRLRSSGWMQ